MKWDSGHLTRLSEWVNYGKIVQVIVQVICPSGGQGCKGNTGLRDMVVDSSPQVTILYSIFHIPYPC